MADELEKVQNRMDKKLDVSLNNAVSIITRDYLEQLENYQIVKPSEEDIDIDIAECGRFYKLTRLVVNREENFLDKLTTIVNVASSIECSIATIIKSDGDKIDYYFGILSKNARDQKQSSVKRRTANAAAFKGALLGNLIGSELEELSGEEVNRLRKYVLAGEGNCYSSVSGIVSLRSKENGESEQYVQGLENLVDSLKGLKYTIVMLADPVTVSEIQEMEQGYEMIHTQLSTFSGSSVTMNESDTLSLSKADTEGITEGISQGIAMTQSKTKSKSRYIGGSVSMGINVGLNLNFGVNAGVNSSTAYTDGRTDSRTQSETKNRAHTSTSSSSRTSGKNLQLTFKNRSVKSLLDKIDRHLKRLDECKNFGAFDCAAYVIADNRETALTAAGNYNALMRGHDSGIQASHINSWVEPEDTVIFGKYMGSLVHPRFRKDESDKIIVTPASIISGSELAIQVGLPRKSVTGITVIPMAPFGRNVIEESDATLELGSLCYMGYVEENDGRGQKVRIDLEGLAMHTFITGSTGSGKSTAIYSLLDKLMVHNVKGSSEKIKFLVIEPAKGEYKDRFGRYPNVNVYGTNYKKTPLLKINPFSFPEDIHVLEHIDRLIEIFNVCWPMYAAMPAVLKDAIEKAYIVSGWDLNRSECRYRNQEGIPLFPSFLDVVRQIYLVINQSEYSSDSKGDYKGALCTRLKSLTNGLYGQIFTSDELSAEELFDSNVIVDLSRVGSAETKSLIMGLLVMKLQEYRMASSFAPNASLKHVTVLEEAHNILKKTSSDQTGEDAGLLRKSVEMLANSIAEMRTYGEGFIIADQAPGLMDPSVIRNTNTKIILRLPDLKDRELVGRAAGLNDEQILELSRLKTFVAAVYQNNWLEPVLCKIDTNFMETPCYRFEYREPEKSDEGKILKYLLLPVYERDHLDRRYVDELIDDVYRLPISAETKVAFIRYTNASEKTEIQKLRGQIVYHLFNSDIAFDLAKGRENDRNGWYLYMKELLEPSISYLSEKEQDKVVLLLTKEKAMKEQNQELKTLFESFMEHM